MTANDYKRLKSRVREIAKRIYRMSGGKNG